MDKLFQDGVNVILHEITDIQQLCPPHYTPAAWLEILRLREMRTQTEFLRSIAESLEGMRLSAAMTVNGTPEFTPSSQVAEPVGMSQAVANQRMSLKGKR